MHGISSQALVLHVSYICNHNFLAKEMVMFINNSSKACNMEYLTNEIISFLIVVHPVQRNNVYSF